MTQPTIAQLHNLTDRAGAGLTADEQQRLRDGIDQLSADLDHARAEASRWAEAESADAAAGSYAGRAEQAEADLEQARADAEQHARNTLTVARERDSYRKAWKEEQQRRARAEAALIRPGLVPDDNPVTDIDPAWTPPPPGDKREHAYLSTGCFHGDHGYCQSMTGLNGAKRPASCKFCQASCRCECHAEAEQPVAP